MADWRRDSVWDSLRRSEAPRPRRGAAHSDSECLLPAIATVAAITAAPATAAVAAASTATATSATAAGALCLGTRFIHHEVSPAEVLPVQGINRAIRIFVSVDFDERETARLARETVADEIDARGRYTDLRKPLVELIFRRGERKITDIELLHLSLLLPGT